MAFAIGIWNGIDMSKKANGQGYTFKVGSSFRTVIKHNGYVVTALPTPLDAAVCSSVAI